MNPRNALLIAGNRGIGLQMVKDLLQLNPMRLIVTYRDQTRSNELLKLAKDNACMKLVQLDLSVDFTDDKVEKFVSEVEFLLEGEGLNLYINNAGVLISEPIDVPTLTQAFTINAFAPLIIAKALMPLIIKAAKSSSSEPMTLSRSGVVFLTTKVASMGDNNSGGIYMYRGSKIALNMFAKNLSIEYGSEGVLFLLLHPGWVKTDLGGKNALITTKESVQGMMQVMGKCTQEDQCKFYDFAGKEIPW